MWTRAEWLDFMRSAPWYKEREGLPMCIEPGCRMPAAWVVYKNAELQICTHLEPDALPLNVCCQHRNDQKYGIQGVHG